MKSIFFLIILAACADIERPHTYLVHEDNQTCEGSYLEMSEQVRIMRETTGNLGYSCDAMPVPLKNDKTYYRVFCDSAGGRLPGHEGIAPDKDTCKLALEQLKIDPRLGYGKATIQAQEASWWVADFKDQSCVLIGPVSMEEVVVQLEKKTKKICKVAQIDETLPDLRTIVCGDKGYVITGTEQLCQNVISAEKKSVPPATEI
ncbi:MAG: hypothetical protein ACJ76H_14535 [Bacteriovoracaceae bacterium]